MVYEKKLLAKDLQAGNVATKTADVDLADDALSFNEDNAGRLTSAQLLEQIEIRQHRAEEELADQTLCQRLLFSSIPVRIRPSMLVTCLGVFAAFSGILSGFDQSIISGATHGVQHHFTSGTNPEWHWTDDTKTQLDSHSSSQWSLVSSLMPLGAMAGSLMIDPLHAVFGRRGSIIQSCLWYTLGAGLCAGCRSVGMLYAGRFILGVGVGIEGGSVGIYIGESVPKEVRGSLVYVRSLLLTHWVDTNGPQERISAVYCLGRSVWLRMRRHFLRRTLWFLALHARQLSPLLDNSPGWSPLHARISTLA